MLRTRAHPRACCIFDISALRPRTAPSILKNREIRRVLTGAWLRCPSHMPRACARGAITWHRIGSDAPRDLNAQRRIALRSDPDAVTIPFARVTLSVVRAAAELRRALGPGPTDLSQISTLPPSGVGGRGRIQRHRPCHGDSGPRSRIPEWNHRLIQLGQLQDRPPDVGACLQREQLTLACLRGPLSGLRRPGDKELPAAPSGLSTR